MSKKTFNKKSTEKPIIGNEPEVNLSAYYKSADDPQIEADLKALETSAASFEKKYKGKIATLNAKKLLACLKNADKDASLAARLNTYSYLMMAKDNGGYSSFYGQVMDRLTAISKQGVFFDLELGNIPQKDIQKKMKQEPGLSLYKTLLEGAVTMQPYRLSQDAEETLLSLPAASPRRWRDLFDKMAAETKYNYRGTELSLEQLAPFTSSTDRSERKDAYAALQESMKETLWLRNFITNTLSSFYEQEDKLRGFPKPVSRRNLANNIDDSIVEALNEYVTKSYPETSHRFYKMKAKILGLKKLHGYDRNAPISMEVEEKISYDEAKDIVLTAYRSVSPEMADIAQKFFDNNWIDARITKGKRGGAFSHGGSVDVHPVVFVNYAGTPRCIATLAHELGHAIHQYLAGRNLKSQMMAGTPLTLAETASVFGERVTFQLLLDREQDPKKRAVMLAAKIDDMINTVVRQNAFFNFEKTLHEKRRTLGRDLKDEEINQIYLDTQKEALGPAFELEEGYGMQWAYVPHFIHSPYYVYSYAFGECNVTSLYKKYQETDDRKGFVKNYLTSLKSGGSREQKEMFKDLFNSDISDPNFWDSGIKDMVDRLEHELKLAKKAEKKPKGPNNKPS